MRESSCWTRFYKKYLMELKKKLLILSLTAGFLILAAIYFRHSLRRRPPGIEEMWKEQLYVLAGRSYESGEYEDAAELIQEILRIDPQNRRALSELARISALKGETGRALSILEDIVDDEAGFETQEEYLYTLYDYVHLLIEEDRVKEAGQYLELIVSRDPDEGWVFRELARISALKGDSRRAISILEDIVDDEDGFETEEDYLHTLHDYIHLLLEEDRVKEAGQYLELILDRDPEEGWVFRLLARISALKRESGRALSILEDIIDDEERFETEEEYLHTLFEFIDLLMREEKNEEAEKYLEVIETRELNQYWMRRRLANIYSRGGCHDRALSVLEEIIDDEDGFETWEEYSWTLREYAAVYYRKGDPEEAEKILNSILERDPRSYWSLFHLSRIKYLRGELEKIKEILLGIPDYAIEEDKNLFIYVNAMLAQVYLDMEEREKALEYFEKYYSKGLDCPFLENIKDQLHNEK